MEEGLKIITGHLPTDELIQNTLESKDFVLSTKKIVVTP